MGKKIWSVELEANCYNDDTFNGTYQQCLDYIKDHDYQDDVLQLALIELDNKGCVTYTHQIIQGSDLEL